MALKIHSRYDLPPSEAVVFDLERDGMSQTLQQFADDADINNIMQRYDSTGFLVDPLTQVSRKPMYGDYTLFGDFQTQCDLVNAGYDLFDSLSSDLRARFEHDPVLFFDFVLDPANHDEAVRLGIALPDVARAQSITSESGEILSPDSEVEQA